MPRNIPPSTPNVPPRVPLQYPQYLLRPLDALAYPSEPREYPSSTLWFTLMPGKSPESPEYPGRAPR